MAAEVDKAWRRTVGSRGREAALVDAATERTWSFEEVESAVAQAVDDLSASGIEAGEVLVLAEPNGLVWLSTFLAAQRLGVVVLPLELQLGAERIRKSARSAGARLLRMAEWEAIGGERRFPPGSCLIKATSGSTGDPKLYVFKDEEMLADGRQVMAGMGLMPEDRNYAVIPFGHSYGLGNLVFPLILEGLCIVCGKGYFPQEMLEDLVRHEISVFPAVPPLVRALSRSDVLPGLRLKQVISAGGRLDSRVRDTFMERFKVPVRNFYGSSETGGIAFNRRLPQPGDPVSVGEPLPGVCIELDVQGGVSVSSAAVYTEGNPLRQGEYGKVEVADIGHWNDNGELELTGRRKGQVKIAGRRISLAEIEAAVRQMNGVDDCWIHAFPDRGDELAIACVVAGEAPVERLRANMRESLPVWVRPKKCVVVPFLPLNARGKTCRQQMLALLGLEN
ncbi:MAG: acyl--CoA ligase [Opitutales bacterium]|nr:acyl--CoA ligase [Opitutales bacterium]